MSASMDEREMYWRLCDALGAHVDRRGEAHAQCPNPNCRKEPKPGQTHFSFSERGAKCFVCGAAWTVRGLYRQVIEGTVLETAPAPKPRIIRRDRPYFDAEVWERWLSGCRTGPERFGPWQQYAPALEQRTILQRGFTVGTFPARTSKCPHERLIVPMWVHGRLLGVRGRALTCDCGKWLGGLGSRLVLYNGGVLGAGDDIGDSLTLGAARGRWVWIVENPVDAVLLEQSYSDLVAVATLGVAMWRDAWTSLLIKSRCLGAIVAYDNDAPGNVTPGCAEAIATDWASGHGQVLPANGNRLVNRLLEAGVKARLFAWPAGTPIRADVGDFVRNTRRM